MPPVSELMGGSQCSFNLGSSDQVLAFPPRQRRCDLHRSAPPRDDLWIILQDGQQTFACRLIGKQRNDR